MFRSICLLICFAAATASAQTIYEPIEYEYNVGGTLYFYGGDQPAVHSAAGELAPNGAAWGRHNGFAFASASTETSREVETERIRVFSDSFRSGLADATQAGFAIADARNQAYASVPRYFQKRDLLRQATATADGTRLVPARAGGIVIRKSSGQVIAEPLKPLMILPKPEPKRRDSLALRSSVD